MRFGCGIAKIIPFLLSQSYVLISFLLYDHVFAVSFCFPEWNCTLFFFFGCALSTGLRQLQGVLLMDEDCRYAPDSKHGAYIFVVFSDVDLSMVALTINFFKAYTLFVLNYNLF